MRSWRIRPCHRIESEVRRSLAVVIIGRLLSAALRTLPVIPAECVTFESHYRHLNR
jgi:Cu/Ag efflux pump CusA